MVCSITAPDYSNLSMPQHTKDSLEQLAELDPRLVKQKSRKKKVMSGSHYFPHTYQSTFSPVLTQYKNSEQVVGLRQMHHHMQRPCIILQPVVVNRAFKIRLYAMRKQIWANYRATGWKLLYRRVCMWGTTGGGGGGGEHMPQQNVGGSIFSGAPVQSQSIFFFLFLFWPAQSLTRVEYKILFNWRTVWCIYLFCPKW